MSAGKTLGLVVEGFFNNQSRARWIWYVKVMNRWGAALRLIGVGFYVGGCIVLGVLVGLWLDTKLDTRPILVIVGLVFGLIIAFYGVYQLLLPLMGDKQKKGDS